MSTYTCVRCGRSRADLPSPDLSQRAQLSGWTFMDDASGLACPACNPYNRLPLRTIWQKGWDAFVADLPCDPPYVNYSNHGGTFGTRANRVWQDGWHTASENIGICEYCSGQVMSSDACDVCGGHMGCCPGHFEEDEDDGGL